MEQIRSGSLDIDNRPCIQDPGFLNTPHALWAMELFLAIAGGAASAVESVERYGGLTTKKKKASCLPGRNRPDFEFHN
jgi:hypothetical protein